MQKLKNTINLMSAVMLTATVLFTFALSYITHINLQRDAALADRIQALEARINSGQQKEIVELEQDPSTFRELAGQQGDADEAALLPEERKEIRAALAVAKSMIKGRTRPNTPETRLGEAAQLLKTNRVQGLAEFRKEILDLDKAKTDPFLIEVGLRELEARAPEEIEGELRAYYEKGSFYVKALAAGKLASRGDDSLLREFLPDLKSEMLDAGDPINRVQGLQTLGYTYNPMGTPYAIEMLQDESVLVRARAAEVLGMMGGAQAARELARLLEDENASPVVRDEALRALNKIEAGRLIRQQ